MSPNTTILMLLCAALFSACSSSLRVQPSAAAATMIPRTEGGVIVTSQQQATVLVSPSRRVWEDGDPLEFDVMVLNTTSEPISFGPKQIQGKYGHAKLWAMEKGLTLKKAGPGLFSRVATKLSEASQAAQAVATKTPVPKKEKPVVKAEVPRSFARAMPGNQELKSINAQTVSRLFEESTVDYLQSGVLQPNQYVGGKIDLGKIHLQSDHEQVALAFSVGTEIHSFAFSIGKRELNIAPQ